MDIETIKVIANTFKEIGIEGKSAFLWWIALDFVKYIVGSVCLAWVIVVVVKLLTRVLGNNLEQVVMEIRAILQVGRPGEITQTEISEILVKIRELRKFKDDHKA